MYSLIKPILFKLDPEQAHNYTFAISKLVQKMPALLSALETLYRYNSPRLVQKVLGITYSNPIGLAAGFDKNVEIPYLLQSLGFGFLEFGSITALPSNGNAKPRLFRLAEDQALINRLGLNNKGVDALLKPISELDLSIPFAINITKTHSPDILGDDGINDIVNSFIKLYPFGLYHVINVSCPNTKEGKTFESATAVSKLLGRISTERKKIGIDKPLFIKFSADIELSELQACLLVCDSYGVDGYIISNTSTKRTNLLTDQAKLDSIGKGGLSGKPLLENSLKLVSFIWQRFEGRKPIIGLGGISSAEDAIAMMQAGASLVQLYTGLVYQGPGVIKKIVKGMDEYCQREKINSISEIIGTKLCQ